jgi:hypothetical protein
VQALRVVWFHQKLNDEGPYCAAAHTAPCSMSKAFCSSKPEEGRVPGFAMILEYEMHCFNFVKRVELSYCSFWPLVPPAITPLGALGKFLDASTWDVYICRIILSENSESVR